MISFLFRRINQLRPADILAKCSREELIAWWHYWAESGLQSSLDGLALMIPSISSRWCAVFEEVAMCRVGAHAATAAGHSAGAGLAGLRVPVR